LNPELELDLELEGIKNKRDQSFNEDTKSKALKQSLPVSSGLWLRSYEFPQLSLFSRSIQAWTRKPFNHFPISSYFFSSSFLQDESLTLPS
jgi:hypothetical protein